MNSCCKSKQARPHCRCNEFSRRTNAVTVGKPAKKHQAKPVHFATCRPLNWQLKSPGSVQLKHCSAASSDPSSQCTYNTCPTSNYWIIGLYYWIHVQHRKQIFILGLYVATLNLSITAELEAKADILTMVGAGKQMRLGEVDLVISNHHFHYLWNSLE